MFIVKSQSERFCEYVSSHVLGRYPGSRKRARQYVFSVEMVTYVDMFGMRCDSLGVHNC